MAKDSTIYAPIHHGLWLSPKLKEVCSATGLPGPYVAGHLAAIWTHTANSRPEGILSDWTDARIEAVAEWQGKPGELVAAIVAAGFAHRAGESDCPCMEGMGAIRIGTVVLHEWAIYTGAGLSRRTADARRKREKRTASTGRPQDGPHMSTDSPQMSATSPQMSALTGPDRTGPDLTGPEGRGLDRTGIAPAAPEPPLPPDFDPFDPELAPTHAEKAQERDRAALAKVAAQPRLAQRARSEGLYGRPQSIDGLLAWDPDGQGPMGERWAKDYPALDGRQGRVTLRTAVANLWPHSIDKPWGDGRYKESWVAWWCKKLSDDHDKARRTYDRDQGAPIETRDKPQTALDLAWEEELARQRREKAEAAGPPAPAPPPEPPPDHEPKAPRPKRAISPEARAELERARAELGQGPRQDRGKRGSGVPAVGSLLGDVVGNQGGQNAV